MTGESDDPASARAELRGRLETGRATAGVTVTQLARRAGLGRTTVSEAFSASASALVPSAQTVGALARALGLAPRPLLDLRAAACETGRSVSDRAAEPEGIGRPIKDWNPHDLEVHPAIEVASDPSDRAPAEGAAPHRRTGTLPRYVPREHDTVLADLVDAAAAGSSGMAVLVGSSSTGKTRACWEAVQPLAEQGWLLWHPFDPSRVEAARAGLERVAPRTVLWLNEAQHYLDAGEGLGERMAAALHTLLTDPGRGPVLVLGTLWPEYAHTLTARPEPGGPDRHTRVRELLAGRQIPVQDCFDSADILAAKGLAAAGDRQLAHALAHAGDGRLTQFLAGAPELMHRYRIASPAARALLQAAVDARRLGTGLHLPADFLAHAAEGYPTEAEWNILGDDWLERAWVEVGEVVHGNLAPLNPVRRERPGRWVPGAPRSVRPAQPSYRLADYLEQQGRVERRDLCPPASFWAAAHDHLTDPDDIERLADAASVRRRDEWAHHLEKKAAGSGNVAAMVRRAAALKKAGHHDDADRLAQRVLDADGISGLLLFVQAWEQAGDSEGAERFARRALAAGDSGPIGEMAVLREKAGDHADAERLAVETVGVGGSHAVLRLVRARDLAGDRSGAERLAQGALTAGDSRPMHLLALTRRSGLRKSGARVSRQDLTENIGEAVRLSQLAAASGDAAALGFLADTRSVMGRSDEAEIWEEKAVAAGDPSAMFRRARRLEETGDHAGARRLAQRVVASGDSSVKRLIEERAGRDEDPEGAMRIARLLADVGSAQAHAWLALRHEKAGDPDKAEHHAHLAVEAGTHHVWSDLADIRAYAGDPEGAESAARQAPGWEATFALGRLAQMREAAGDHSGAERLTRETLADGDASDLARLMVNREEAGDHAKADSLARLAADSGLVFPLLRLAQIRNGLDRDQVPVVQRFSLWIPGVDMDSLIRLGLMAGPSGYRAAIQHLARQAADAGNHDTEGLVELWDESGRGEVLWPYGLDPDGTPSAPWAPDVPPFDFEITDLE